MRLSAPEGGWGPPAEMADPAPERLAGALRQDAGETLSAVLLFGSRLARTKPGAGSAYDLVVVVRDYRSFYRRMRRARRTGRPTALVSALARVLPPNVTAYDPGVGAVAKCLILTEEALARGLSPRSRDHFLKGRLVQKVALLHARDAAAAARMGALLDGARDRVLDWVGPFLEAPFTTAGAARTMLRVSYRGEVRPESGDRADAVFRAQETYLEAVLARALNKAREQGDVIREGEGWRFTEAPTGGARRRVRRYFRRSKARATARWLKHVVTFDNWLDYIAHKVERRTGVPVDITPWERRLPYLLLWPKVVKVLRSRPARLAAADEDEP